MCVAFVVFAAFGVHLIEPFFSHTIATGATHSQLKEFYSKFYIKMNDDIISQRGVGRVINYDK